MHPRETDQPPPAYEAVIDGFENTRYEKAGTPPATNESAPAEDVANGKKGKKDDEPIKMVGTMELVG